MPSLKGMSCPADNTALPLSQEEIKRFREAVYSHYREFRRDFPWRETTDPYRILVSEVMLQQTGVERVRGPYSQFIASFPRVPDPCRGIPSRKSCEPGTALDTTGEHRTCTAPQRLSERSTGAGSPQKRVSSSLFQV